MASRPSDPKPVLGRVDRDGRLIEADPELERLQVEAGSRLGAPIALPQLAGIVRMTQRLGIPVSRRILAAGNEQDVDMRVRAAPDGDEIAITIEEWSVRPAAPPRLAAMAADDQDELAGTQLLWSVDERLRIVAVAPLLAELLSIDQVAAAGQPLTKLFRLEIGDDGEMPILASLASRSSFSDQRVKARQTGREFVLSGDVAFDPDGAFVGFEGSVAPANDTRSDDLAQPAVDGAIHSALRSPLDSIVRSAEEMIDRAGGAGRDEYAVYAADIAAAARHLLSVIRSLGQQAERQGLHPVELPELASEAISLIEPSAREREIAITVRPVESLTARAQAPSVVQILVNLIGNAVRYSPERSAVTVSFETADGSALVHVSDQGPGIDPADHDRIFEPFERGKGVNEGSGLGLSIARRLARAMDGDIRVQSSPGEGSRFTLALPVA